ncbi:ABC transporter permease [Glaciibacter superstes]|uniref:ABC transporter permease n=1 Tax=Glaciibacter superstes TaxID=501023 RepID=UPI0003B7658C|nr:ABC transporter permease [Glaciibacter superstes]
MPQHETRRPLAAPKTTPIPVSFEKPRKNFHVDLLLWFCILWLGAIVLAAIFAPLLPLAEAQDASKTLMEPTNQPPFTVPGHPLGTNGLGLDIFARLIYGARISLTVGVAAVAIGMAVGAMLGTSAGYLRGAWEAVIGVLTNTLLAVPALILLIALSTVLRPSVVSLTFSLALVASPGLIRLARANTLAFTQREFITVARALGAKPGRVILRELLPNVLLSMMSLSFVYISVLIVAEASLGFLGVGIRQPTPSWGNMIAEGLGGKMEQYPHLVFIPATVLFLTVFSFNLLGERMRKRWDKREVSL